MKYECFMTLRDEALILVRTILLLHVLKINCISIVSILNKGEPQFYIHLLQEGHIVANIPNFFHSNSQFPERVIVCSPMTNNEIFSRKIKNTISEFDLVTL